MASQSTTAPKTADPPVPAPRYVPELDGVRGIAILLVIAFHFGLFDIDSHRRLYTLYRSTIELGWAGVDLFFVLSGCLITGILLDSKHSAHYFRSFYMRRVLRILPLYYLSVLVFFWVFFPIAHAVAPAWLSRQEWTHIGGTEQIWYWLHVSNWRSAYGVLQLSPVTHFWSLAIEEQFYVVWPLVVLCCSEAGLLNVCVGLILVSAGLRNIPQFQEQVSRFPDFLYRITPFRVEPLAFGAMLALLSRRAGFRQWSCRWLWLPLALGAVTLVSIVSITGSGGYRSEPMSRYGFTAVSLICFALVGYARLNAGGSPVSARLLRAPPLVSIGKYSYAMYVLHLPVAFFWPAFVRASSFGGSRLVMGAASILCGTVISYLLALLSWHAIERRFLSLKDRFSYGSPVGAERGQPASSSR